jgi:hypothetical protein
MRQDRKVLDVNLSKNLIRIHKYSYYINNLYFAPFISKTKAAFEREIIQVINNLKI